MILDDDFLHNASKLTDFQLIGILEAKVAYEDKVYQIVKKEIKARKLSPETIDRLSAAYHREHISKDPFPIHGSIYWLSGLFLALIIYSPTILGVLLGIIVYISSLWAIRLRVIRGKEQAVTLWKRLNYFMLLMIVIVLSWQFFL